jgi:GAF domain-containing protein
MQSPSRRADTVPPHTQESFDDLASAPEKELDELSRLAARACATSMAKLVFFTSSGPRVMATFGTGGIDPQQLGSFCELVLEARDVLVVPDATKDPRFAGHAIVAGPPHVHFFAGAPVRGSDGRAFGVLAVMDPASRNFTTEQTDVLSTLAARVTTAVELQRTMRALQESERRHRMLFEQNPIAIGVWRSDDRKIVAANDAMAALYGYPRGELVGLRVEEIFVPEELPRFAS